MAGDLDNLYNKVNSFYEELDKDFKNEKHYSYKFYLSKFNNLLHESQALGISQSTKDIQDVPIYEAGNYARYVASAYSGLFKDMPHVLSQPEIDKHSEIKVATRTLRDGIKRKIGQGTQELRNPATHEDILKNLFKKFPAVAEQLLKRHENRETLKIIDEYDVQDLIHSLLCLFFDDIISEEGVPSSAGFNSRIDFILRDESVGIEIKSTVAESYTKENSTKNLSKELKIDIQSYKKHPKIRELCCFVYDPDHLIDNPDGFEKDLSEQQDNYKVFTYVYPKP